MRRPRLMSADEARARGCNGARGLFVGLLIVIVLYGAMMLLIWAATT